MASLSKALSKAAAGSYRFRVDRSGAFGNSGKTATAGGPTVPPALMDDARKAKEAFERGEYPAAEKVYEKMLSKAPSNVYILSNLGVVYFRNGKWSLAEEALKKAIAVAPEDTFSQCTLGIVYYQQHKYDDATTSLTKALAINPKYAVAHNYLGITASQKGWGDAALKELETAIQLDPTTRMPFSTWRSSMPCSSRRTRNWRGNITSARSTWARSRTRGWNN